MLVTNVTVPQFSSSVLYWVKTLYFIVPSTTATNRNPRILVPTALRIIIQAKYWKQIGKLAFLPEASTTIRKLNDIGVFNKKMEEELYLQVIKAPESWNLIMNLQTEVIIHPAMNT